MDKVNTIAKLEARYPDIKLSDKLKINDLRKNMVDVNGKIVTLIPEVEKVACPGISKEAGRAMKPLINSSDVKRIQELCTNVIKLLK